MKRVFGDLVLTGIGKPLEMGTFFFDKGVSKNFLYKNLSGGEKAAFDLILDLVLKITHYDKTIYCIDEPDLHMNTKVQSSLLQELNDLIPENCQLWVATHSIGMMRKAKDLHETNPGSVVFLDFSDIDFDQDQTISPTKVSRVFWRKTLNVALDDLSELVVPKVVVICEGKPVGSTNSKNTEFDAKCLRKIFEDEFSDADFIFSGASTEVENDRLALIKSLQIIAKGVIIIRIIDRDDRSKEEVEQLKTDGIKVLSRRNIESYLLDDEILTSLCKSRGKGDDEINALINEKKSAITNSVNRGNPKDDLKSARGEIYNAAKKILEANDFGSNANVFCRDIMAPLVVPETSVYQELKEDIFGTN